MASPFYIRWRDWEGGKLLLGGSLAVPITVENKRRLLLAGILHGSSFSYGSTKGFFTNIIPLVKYIRYQVNHHGSQLCKENLFQLDFTKKKTVDEDSTKVACEKQGEGGPIPALDIVLTRIILKAKEFNKVVLSTANYKKLYTSDSVTNKDSENDKQNVNFHVPNELKPANSLSINTIPSINRISRTISIEEDEDIDKRFRYRLGIKSKIRDTYHSQVHRESRPGFSPTGVGGLLTTALSCTTMSVFVDCMVAENVKLNYEAFVEISGQLDNEMFIGADDIKQNLPKEFEVIESKDCHTVKAKGKEDITFSFIYDEQWHEVKTKFTRNPECKKKWDDCKGKCEP